MKTNRPATPQLEQQPQERALFTAILALESVEECHSFFRDICTPSELQEIATRWVEILERDKRLPDRG
jgi:uncharacterized protein YerC